MTSSILDADVKEFCIHVMKKLIEKTQKDENKTINKNDLYEETCAASKGIGSFDSSNVTLKNRVFQELFTRGHIKQGNSPEEIKITDIGKNYPEYLDT
jgi:hypothetical protein